MSLEQVFYVSRCCRPLSASDARLIVGTSQMLNRRADISGLLVYAGGFFAQVIEGERGRLDALLQRIGLDPRHEAFRLLLRRGVAQRVFGHWSMELLLSEALAGRIEAACIGDSMADAAALQLLDGIIEEASLTTGVLPPTLQR